MSFVDIHHGREIQLAIDDLVSLWSGFKTGKNQRLTNGNILMHRHAARLSTNDLRDLVADRQWHVPPTFSPGAYAASCPYVCVFMQPIEGRARHRPQTV